MNPLQKGSSMHKKPPKKPAQGKKEDFGNGIYIIWKI